MFDIIFAYDWIQTADATALPTEPLPLPNFYFLVLVVI